MKDQKFDSICIKLRKEMKWLGFIFSIYYINMIHGQKY